MTKGGNIRHGTPTIPSSPPQAPAVSPRSKKSTKPRKPPPITPKRFTRFFTPRSSSSIQSRSKSSRQLRDITKSAVNRSSSQLRLKPPFSVQSIDENGNLSAASTPGLTPPKRKLDLTPPTSPIPHSSPSKRPRIDGVNVSRPEIPSSPPPLPVLEEEGETSFAADNYDISEPNFSSEITFCQPIKRLRMSNTSLRILERSFGGLETQRRGFRTDSCIGNDYATRDFYSSEKDVHRHVRKGVPFAAAACHTNSLIAVATESGRIHIIDSDKSSAFEECHIMMRPLENAVTDLEFSADDSMLAIGCGDKSMRLIDMQSQRVKMVFKDHWGCIKQVRFRPGDPHVIATCCREGIVNLWDSRCRGEMRPVFTEIVHGDTRLGATSVKVEYKAEYQSNPNRSWPRAHSDRLNMKLLNDGPKGFRDLGKGDIVFADKDISVTALTFLSPERNHLLVTGSEACTSLRLWDIRSRYSRRASGESTPVSSTMTPYHHQKTRPFGITAISTNKTSSRIYALSRDSTIYAFSTQHLVLGSVPEMLQSSSTPHRYSTENQTGLGPIFGLRHPDLIVSSFYVKAAIRRPSPSADKPELIATGSADGNVFVFPTDEQDIRLRATTATATTTTTTSSATATADIDALSSSATPAVDLAARKATPVYWWGTRLGHGHSQRNEVSHVAWTRDGDLVSCGDDFKTRIWREDAGRARDLRRDGYKLGAQTNWVGYAEVDEDEDDEELDSDADNS